MASTKPTKPIEPARRAFGPAFDLISKAVFAQVAFEVVKLCQPEGEQQPADVRRKFLAMWEQLLPLGLPTPHTPARILLTNEVLIPAPPEPASQTALEAAA